MAFMARLPPSLITLGSAEIQSFLQGNANTLHALRSLALDLDNLHLNDPNRPRSNYIDADGNDDGEGLSSPSSFHDETTKSLNNTPEEALSGIQSTSIQETGASTLALDDPTPSFLASGMTKSAHQAPGQNNPSSSDSTNTTHNVPIPMPMPSLRPRGRPSSSLNIPLRRVAFVATPQHQHSKKDAAKHCRLKENYRQSHRHSMQTLSDVKSRLSTTPRPRLSLGSIPDMTIDSVPLRDLALASTMSYEAVLAATMISPSSIAVPIQEYGTIQPDSVFNETSTDRDGE